MYNKG
jgi:alpha-amylase